MKVLVNILYQEMETTLSVFTKRNTFFPLHIHRFIEVVIMGDGEMVLNLEHEDIVMRKGDVAVLFPGVIHGFQVDDIQSKGTYLLYSPMTEGSAYNIIGKHYPKNPVLKRDAVPKEIGGIIKIIENASQEAYNNELKIAGAEFVLYRLFPLLDMKLKTEDMQNNIIYQLIAYIGENFKTDITLNSVSKHFGISPYTVSRIFSKTFGMNFARYVNGYRLENASVLLKYSDKSILEIYMESGFNSQSTFNRVFKENFGMTPENYRKKAGKDRGVHMENANENGRNKTTRFEGGEVHAGYFY